MISLENDKNLTDVREFLEEILPGSDNCMYQVLNSDGSESLSAPISKNKVLDLYSDYYIKGYKRNGKAVEIYLLLDN